MNERYPRVRKNVRRGAAAALAITALAACGKTGEQPSDAGSAKSSASASPSGEASTSVATPSYSTYPENSQGKAASTGEVRSGTSTIICLGVARIAVGGGQYRLVGNPAVDDTHSKHPLFVEDISSAGITLGKEPDSEKPVQWFNSRGVAVGPSDIKCVSEPVFVHEVTQPNGKPVEVVTAQSENPTGTVRLDMRALQHYPNASRIEDLVAHDFGTQSLVASTEMIEHLK